MSPMNETQAFVVSTAQDVLAAGRELRGALDDPSQRAAAADRLALVAEAALGGLDDLAVRNFEAVEGAAETKEPEAAAEDVLTGTVGQLDLSQTLFAAGAAVGELPQEAPGPLPSASAGEPPDLAPTPTPAEQLDHALQHLETSTRVLTVGTPGGRAAPETTPVGPDDRDGSASGLQEQALATLDGLVRGVSEVVTAATPVARRVTQFASAWDQIGKVVPAGRAAGKKLIRLGLRAVEAALNSLYQLVHAEFLAAARDKVHRIWERAGESEAVVAVIGELIGADETRPKVSVALAGDDLDPHRLGPATGQVRELGARFGRLMAMAQTVVLALAAVQLASSWVHIAIPQLPLCIGATALTVIAASVVLGSDYVDSGTGRGLVHGVHGIVLDAVR